MSVSTVALLGAAGQLGRTLIDDWGKADVSCAGRDAADTPDKTLPALVGFTRDELDICDAASLDYKLSELAPDLVINAAAYTAVDRAESDSERAFAVNSSGAANVAAWAQRAGCRLVHISTDFVFDGNACRPYRSGDQAGPVNTYGESKRAGEQAVLDACADTATLVRTSWLYSRFAPNFVTNMLRLMREQDGLRVVVDQIGTPTSTHSLARLLRNIATREICGIYHWSDAGVASWYDFAVAIQQEALQAGLLSRSIPIEPVATSDFPTPAARPAFSVLDKTDSYADLGMEAIHWRVELKRVIEELAESQELETTS